MTHEPVEWMPNERLMWRGKEWFVADVQDDKQHVHLTLVVTPEHSANQRGGYDPNPPLAEFVDPQATAAVSP